MHRNGATLNGQKQSKPAKNVAVRSGMPAKHYAKMRNKIATVPSQFSMQLTVKPKKLGRPPRKKHASSKRNGKRPISDNKKISRNVKRSFKKIGMRLKWIA